MARIRTVKPDFFRHEELYELEKESELPIRVAFAGLFTASDREGRFEWKPRTLKLDCLPHDILDFSRVLDALATRGFIVKYTCNGRDYGVIPSFTTHQVINNRESASVLPPPPEEALEMDSLTRGPRVADACRTPLVQDQGEGKGREGKGKEVASNTRKTRIPEDFQLTEKLIDNARSYWKTKTRTDLNPVEEFEKFKNHYLANGETTLDWSRKWQTWYTNAIQFNKAPTGYQQNQSSGPRSMRGIQ